MNDLTSNQQSFIDRMTDGESFARNGFGILSKREDADKFFDALLAKGLFAANQNSGPQPAAQEGSFYEPYWSALDYLLAIAKKADATRDVALGNKVMAVVRDVSTWKDETGAIRQNSATYWRFAEILGQVPTACVTDADIDLAAVWMTARFNSGMAGHALVQFAFPHFLDGDDPADTEKACRLLWVCTAFKWHEESRRGHEVELVLEDHWFEQLLQRFAKVFGAKAGARASDIFYRRLTELFSHPKRKSTSTLWRPAVEVHKQNMRWHEVENRLVDGLRDVLIAWISTDDGAAAQFVDDKLRDDTEMVRRIALHAVDENFAKFGDMFLGRLSDQTFGIGHIHEMYRLLTRHFAALLPEQRAAIVAVLRKLSPPKPAEDDPSRLKRVQRLWLSAIAGRGSADVDAWYAELQKDPDVGGLSEHPDFLSYHESRAGPGPSPMAVENIIAFAQDGALVDQLNAFTETDRWRGPTVGGLCATVEQAAADEPAIFLKVLNSFQDALPQYQYSVLNGLKRAFDANKAKPGKVNWPTTWPTIFQFCSIIISPTQFWVPEGPDASLDLTPRRAWFATLVADLIQVGARDDVVGYDAAQFPIVRALLGILLERSEALSELSDTTDAVNMSINSGKGRAIEALFNHALKECRLANAGGDGHEAVWKELETMFDAELAKCKNANFEFSALGGHYFANIDYMSSAWLTANLKKLFPAEYPSNMAAAVEGLAYAPASGPIYILLRDAGIIDWAMNHEIGANGRERLVERTLLAYFWGLEALDSPAMRALIAPARLQDLESSAQFLWSVQGEKLPAEKVELILRFWAECLAMLDRTKTTAPSLRSSLSRLAVYISAVGDRERSLLLGVAPYVQTDYNATQFFEELDRLAEADPEAVARAVLLVLQAHAPNYDYEDLIFDLVLKLAAAGQRPAALDMTALLQKSHPKALELFQRLNQQN